MNELFSFFIRTLPFTLGIILVLTSLAFMVEAITYGFYIEALGYEEFWMFFLFALIGVPTLLYGISNASKEIP